MKISKLMSFFNNILLLFLIFILFFSFFFETHPIQSKVDRFALGVVHPGDPEGALGDGAVVVGDLPDVVGAAGAEVVLGAVQQGSGVAAPGFLQ